MLMLNSNDPRIFWFIVIATLWSLPWKGVAMWKAVERKEKIWFVVFLVVNLLAIPEIFYLFFVANKPKEKAPTPTPEA